MINNVLKKNIKILHNVFTFQREKCTKSVFAYVQMLYHFNKKNIYIVLPKLVVLSIEKNVTSNNK